MTITRCTSLLLLFIPYLVFSQGGGAEEPTAKNSRQALIDSYYRLAGHHARLYNGIDRVHYDQRIKGTAFFIADSLIEGSVDYDSMHFEHVPMEFDMYQQQLVILHFERFKFALLPEKLSAFDMAGHRFVKYQKSADQPALPAGIYEHLYTGHSSILVERVVLLNEKVTTEIEREFLPYPHYFVKHEGRFVPCNNSRTTFRLLGPKAKSVKKHLRAKKIRFRKNFENALTESFRYFDTQP